MLIHSRIIFGTLTCFSFFFGHTHTWKLPVSYASYRELKLDLLIFPQEQHLYYVI